MPQINFNGQIIACESGENLRRTLMRAKVGLYNGAAKAIHCRGLGTCGTCAIRVAGELSPPTKIETWRLGFPPHNLSQNLRLACQCKVLGDLEVTKLGGLWGNVETAKDDKGTGS